MKRRFNGKCHNCGKWGHMKADCRSLKRDQADLAQDDEESQDLLFDCDEYAEIGLAAMTKYSRPTYVQEIIKLKHALLPPKEVQVQSRLM